MWDRRKMRYVVWLFPCTAVCHHRKCFHFFASKAVAENFGKGGLLKYDCWMEIVCYCWLYVKFGKEEIIFNLWPTKKCSIVSVVLLGSSRKGVFNPFWNFCQLWNLCLCSWSCVCECIHCLQVHFLLTAKALWILRSVWLDMIRGASFRLIQSMLKGGGKCVNVGLGGDNPCCCFITLRIYGDRSLGTVMFFHQTCSLWKKQKKRSL